MSVRAAAAILIGLGLGLGLGAGVARADAWDVPELAPPPETAVRVDTEGAAIAALPDVTSRTASALVTVRVVRGRWTLAARGGVTAWTEDDRRAGIYLNEGWARSTLTFEATRWWPAAGGREGQWRPVVRARLLYAADVAASVPALRIAPGTIVAGDPVPLVGLIAGARRHAGAWTLHGEGGLEVTGHGSDGFRTVTYLWLGGGAARTSGGTTLGASLAGRRAFDYLDSTDSPGWLATLGVQQRAGAGHVALGAGVQLDDLEHAPLHVTVGYVLPLR